MSRLFLPAGLLMLLASPALLAAGPAEILSVEKIWDKGPHNAFTDLIRFKDRWYCSFRESDAHVGGDGKCRVLASADGKTWEPAGLVSEPGVDLRDPKLSITPDGRLMMVMGGSYYEGKTLKGRQPRVSFSTDGTTWTAPKKVLTPDEWLWRVVWHDGVGYGTSYNAAARTTPEAKKASETGIAPPGPADWKLKLFKTTDGENYTLVTQVDVPGHPNETTVRVLADGRMVALVRREGGDQHGWVGVAKPPFTEWAWKPLPRRVGGPNFIQIPDGRIVAITRHYTPSASTMLSFLDADKGTIDDVLKFPSGGDTSYAGMVWHEGVLWVSYYSSHENKKTSIYLAKVKLAPAGAAPTKSSSLPPPPKSIASQFTPPAEFANLGTYKSPIAFADGSPVKTPEDWARRRPELLKMWHDRMGAWPELVEKPRVEVLATEKRENFTQNKVRLEIAPGKTTDDAYILVPEGKGPFPAVVVVFYEADTGIGRGKSEHRDFALQLARRGFVTLSLGDSPFTYYPTKAECKLQPLSYHAYIAANAFNTLANRPDVDATRIGITGHSYGGKWAMFASCLYDKFAAAAWGDPGVVFDESDSNINYYEPWYLGFESGVDRKRGKPSAENPRTGLYKKMVAEGQDLLELHALMAPRPVLVSGGAQDPPKRWVPLNHLVALNKLLGFENRVALTSRAGHSPTSESNEQLCTFFEWALMGKSDTAK